MYHYEIVAVQKTVCQFQFESETPIDIFNLSDEDRSKLEGAAIDEVDAGGGGLEGWDFDFVPLIERFDSVCSDLMQLFDTEGLLFHFDDTMNFNDVVRSNWGFVVRVGESGRFDKLQSYSELMQQLKSLFDIELGG